MSGLSRGRSAASCGPQPTGRGARRVGYIPLRGCTRHAGADRPRATTGALAPTIVRRASRAAGVPDPEVDAELLLGHVLGLSPRAACRRAIVMGGEVGEADAAHARRRSSRGAPRASRCSTSPGRRRSATSSCASGPASSCRGPRPRWSRSWRSTRCAPRRARADRGRPRHRQRRDRARAGDRGAARAGVRRSRTRSRRSPGRGATSTQSRRRQPRARLRRPRRRVLPELDGRVAVVDLEPAVRPGCARSRVDPEVRLLRPRAALYGGADGLDVVRVLSRRAAALPHPGGTLVIEHGEAQSAAIAAILAADGWRAIAHHRDLTTRDRATTACAERRPRPVRGAGAARESTGHDCHHDCSVKSQLLAGMRLACRAIGSGELVVIPTDTVRGRRRRLDPRRCSAARGRRAASAARRRRADPASPPSTCSRQREAVDVAATSGEFWPGGLPPSSCMRSRRCSGPAADATAASYCPTRSRRAAVGDGLLAVSSGGPSGSSSATTARGRRPEDARRARRRRPRRRAGGVGDEVIGDDVMSSTIRSTRPASAATTDE